MSRRNTQKIMLTPELREEILKYVRCGVENIKIAQLIGICEKSFYELLKHNKDLKIQVDECKLISNSAVENSIYNQAVGFWKEEEKVITLAGGLHGTSTSEIVKYMRYYAPSFQAGKHWLNNRNPNRWKEKTELSVKVEDLSDAKLEETIRDLLLNGESDETED